MEVSAKPKLSVVEARGFYDTFYALLMYVNKVKRIYPLYLKKEAYADPDRMTELARIMWDDTSLLDGYLGEHPRLSAEKKDLILGLKRYRNGAYILAEHTPRGALLVSQDDTVYLVKGLKTTFQELLYLFPMPTKLTATLLPWKGCIVTDGLLLPEMEQVDSETKQKIREIVKEAKEQGKVVTTI